MDRLDRAILCHLQAAGRLTNVELAELPGLARVNSQFTMKMVKASGGLPIDG